MTVATTRSLNARASSPTQTPVVRRTGTITPVVEQPKKKSVIGSIFIALLLLGVIAYGVQKLRPVIEDARKINAAQKPADNDSATAPAPADNGTNTSRGESGRNRNADRAAIPETAAAEKKPAEPGGREARSEEERAGCERAGGRSTKAELRKPSRKRV